MTTQVLLFDPSFDRPMLKTPFGGVRTAGRTAGGCGWRGADSSGQDSQTIFLTIPRQAHAQATGRNLDLSTSNHNFLLSIVYRARAAIIARAMLYLSFRRQNNVPHWTRPNTGTSLRLVSGAVSGLHSQYRKFTKTFTECTTYECWIRSTTHFNGAD